MADDTVRRRHEKGEALAAVGHLRIAGWPPHEAARPLGTDDAEKGGSPQCPEVTK